MYQVNVFAPLCLIQLLLPRLSASGGRIVNVSSDAAVEPYPGWGGYGSAEAALVLGPDRPARAVDGLITGLHEPEVSHLLLLEAVAGTTLVQRAYDAAIENRYLWHEFGDSCLLLPSR